MIVDPPYRRHVHKSAVSASKSKGTRSRDLGFDHLGYPLRAFIAGAAAKIPRWSVIYSDVESTNVWRHSCQARGATYIRTIPWVRWSMPQLTGDRMPTGMEALTVYWGSQTGKKFWNGPGNLLEFDEEPSEIVLRETRLGDSKGRHKTQKPLDQALRLVSYLSDPGETVVDLTGGRMTVGVACALLGRNFVAAETQEQEARMGEIRCLKALDGVLADSDPERVLRWVEETLEETAKVFADKTSTEPAREKARRRQSDVKRVERFL